MILALGHLLSLLSWFHCNVPTRAELIRAGCSRLPQVTIRTYWKGPPSEDIHHSRYSPKPCPIATWAPEYSVPTALTKLTNKQNLLQTPIASNSPWISGSSYLPWSRILHSGVWGSQLAFLSVHPVAPSPQSFTLSWHWRVDPLTMTQIFWTLALVTFYLQ